MCCLAGCRAFLPCIPATCSPPSIGSSINFADCLIGYPISSQSTACSPRPASPLFEEDSGESSYERATAALRRHMAGLSPRQQQGSRAGSAGSTKPLQHPLDGLLWRPLSAGGAARQASRAYGEDATDWERQCGGGGGCCSAWLSDAGLGWDPCSPGWDYHAGETTGPEHCAHLPMADPHGGHFQAAWDGCAWDDAHWTAVEAGRGQEAWPIPARFGAAWSADGRGMAGEKEDRGPLGRSWDPAGDLASALEGCGFGAGLEPFEEYAAHLRLQIRDIAGR